MQHKTCSGNSSAFCACNQYQTMVKLQTFSQGVTFLFFSFSFFLKQIKWSLFSQEQKKIKYLNS